METFPQGEIPMKKINKILTVALAAGVLGAGLLAPALSQGKEVKSVAATDPDPILTEITMNEGFFENWNTASDFDFGDSGNSKMKMVKTMVVVL